MTVFMVFLAGCLFAVLVLAQSVRPARARLSIFELHRRQKIRDKKAEDALRREELLEQIGALKAPLVGLLLVALTMLLLHLLGSVNGTLASLVIILMYGRASQLSLVRKVANRLYKRNESVVLGIASRHETILGLFAGKKTLRRETTPLGSKEELAHILELSPIFSNEDKRLLEGTLHFKERTVKDLMTPKHKVVTVTDTELLGPLVLNDLHKTGHTIFPVVKGEAVVGLLDSSNHVDLRTKESVHVRSVMHTDITEVDETVTLNEALKALLATKEQLLIVIGDDGEMAGIVSLKDIVRAIVGR